MSVLLVTEIDLAFFVESKLSLLGSLRGGAALFKFSDKK
jgi:hypothetical protein